MKRNKSRESLEYGWTGEQIMKGFVKHGEKLGSNLWAMVFIVCFLYTGEPWSDLYFLRSFWQHCGEGWSRDIAGNRKNS